MPSLPTETDFGVEILKGFAAQITMALIGFGGSILFARILGPREFGGFALLLLVGRFLDRAFVSWAGATKKRYSEVDSRPAEIVGAQLLVSLGGTALIGFVLFAGSGLITDYTGVANPALPMLLLVAGRSLFSPTQSLLSATGRESLVNWVDALRSLFTFPIQLGLVLLGLGPAGLVYGLAGATLLVVPISLYFVDLRIALPSRETVASLWAFARQNIVIAYLGSMYKKYDTFLLGLLVSQTVVGYYEVSFRLALPALFVTNVVSSGLMPRVSDLDTRGESVDGYLDDAVAFTTIFAIPLFFGVLALREGLVVTIYGAEYRAALPYLIGLALYNVFRSTNNVIRDTLAGLDRQELNIKILGATLLVNLALGYVLVVEIGGLGVVIATIITGILRFLLNTIVTHRLLNGFIPVSRIHLEQMVAGGIMFGIVRWTYNAVGIASWVDLLLLVGAGVIVYGGAAYALSARIRTTSRSLLRRVIA